MVEKNIKGTLDASDRRIFKKYQYGSTIGNHVFDQLVKNTQHAQLGDADYIVLALSYFVEESKQEADEVAYEMFRILLSSYHATYGPILNASVDDAAWTALDVKG